MWLAGAIGAGDHLLAEQHVGGVHDGAWLHRVEMPHTYELRPPWVSAMAQGEGASLLVRLYMATRDERYSEGARRALAAGRVPSRSGGASALLNGESFPEEYPTEPPSFVLNGAIFALWGFFDVGLGLGDSEASQDFAQGASTLAACIHRWDSGYWSYYDLFPHPVRNLASSAYHHLHIAQLRAMSRISEHPELERAADRWQGYSESRVNNARAFAGKSAFRMVVPRTRSLAHRLPWSHSSRRRRQGSALVLCYHAVSPTWDSDLAVTPEVMRTQLTTLVKRGYTGATFADVARGQVQGRVVAITFDDGYRSVLKYGFPVLSELGLTASIYVPTRWVGSDQPMRWPGIDSWSEGPQGEELLCLNWDQLRGLLDAGWEIGSHAVSHPYLPDLSDADLMAELSESRKTVERELGEPCRTLAYPYGGHDDRIEAAAEAAGYDAAAILAAGPVGPYHWPRIGVYASDGRTRFAIKTGRATLMVAFSKLGGYLDRLRR